MCLSRQERTMISCSGDGLVCLSRNVWSKILDNVGGGGGGGGEEEEGGRDGGRR